MSTSKTPKPHTVHDLDQPNYVTLSTFTVATHSTTSSSFCARLQYASKSPFYTQALFKSVFFRLRKFPPEQT